MRPALSPILDSCWPSGGKELNHRRPFIVNSNASWLDTRLSLRIQSKRCLDVCGILGEPLVSMHETLGDESGIIKASLSYFMTHICQKHESSLPGFSLNFPSLIRKTPVIEFSGILV